MRKTNKTQPHTIANIITAMRKDLSDQRLHLLKLYRAVFSLLVCGILTIGLSGCGHDNPLKKASTATLQKGYYQLNNSDRDCIDGIAARSPNSGYKEPKQLHQECQSRYPAIAKSFTNAIGQPVTVSDLQAPNFWLDFFKRDRQRQETLTM